MVPPGERCVCKCRGSECVAPSHVFYLTLSVVLKMSLKPNEAELVSLLDFFWFLCLSCSTEGRCLEEDGGVGMM